MKKYFVEPMKVHKSFLYISIILFLADVIIAVFWKFNNPLLIICTAMAMLLFCCYCSELPLFCPQYSYTSTYIVAFFMNKCYRKIEYTRIRSVVISNAEPSRRSYFNRIRVPQPIEEEVIIDKKKCLVQMPYITLFSDEIIVKYLKPKMSSYYIAQMDNSLYWYVCYFDSLEELLRYVNIRIYILEDVFLRFKHQFMMCCMMANYNFSNLYIICEHNTLNIAEYQRISDK